MADAPWTTSQQALLRFFQMLELQFSMGYRVIFIRSPKGSRFTLIFTLLYLIYSQDTTDNTSCCLDFASCEQIVTPALALELFTEFSYRPHFLLDQSNCLSINDRQNYEHGVVGRRKDREREAC